MQNLWWNCSHELFLRNYYRRASTIKMTKETLTKDGKTKDTASPSCLSFNPQNYPWCQCFHSTHRETGCQSQRNLPVVAIKWWNQNFLAMRCTYVLTKPPRPYKLPRVLFSPSYTQRALFPFGPAQNHPLSLWLSLIPKRLSSQWHCTALTTQSLLSCGPTAQATPPTQTRHHTQFLCW